MSNQHLALYRKYRPQSFDDVVGQEQIVSLLQMSIKQKKVSHAYLFCGGRGTGKTTVARIFARDLGCNWEDILEIDAASNRGIDEIRELREAVRTAPFSSPYKVYIIDEAHMLTREAANALLKTLEEPPSHIIFILATTDPEKLPATIVSRCQKVFFVSPDIKTLALRLMHVAHKEGKNIDEETAFLIAAHGNGSYRDALGVLEQILTTSEKNILYDVVHEYLGVTNKAVLVELVHSICKKDQVLFLESLKKIERGTTSSVKAYDDVIELFRIGLLSRVGEGLENTETVSSIAILAKAHPLVISSKNILELLSKRSLLEVSSRSAWTVFQAMMVKIMDEQVPVVT